MSNLSYHQPKVKLAHNGLLVRTISGHESYVTSVAFFGPLCDRIITGSYDELAKLWDLKTGRCLRKFSGHTDGVTFVMPGPEGRVLTASEDRTIRAWDVDTGECARVIRSHSGAVSGLCMAGPDRVVTCSTDKKIRVFDPSGTICGEAELDGEIMAVAAPSPSPAAVSTDGGVSASSAQVRVFACGGLHIPSPAKPMLRSVDVNIGVTAGAVATNAGSRAGSSLCTPSTTADGSLDTKGEVGVVTCVAISAAGGKGSGVLVAGSYDKGVRVLRSVLSSDPARSGSDEDGEYGAPHESTTHASSSVRMEMLGRHKDGVRSVAISADGRWAVSGGREGHVKVWEIQQEVPSPVAEEEEEEDSGGASAAASHVEPEADFQAHSGVVFSLCMSPDARVLVSAGSDREVRVWDLSLVVYARRMAVNRSRALWAAGRVRRARPKRSSSSGGCSPGQGGGAAAAAAGGAAGGGGVALKAFASSREQRQQILESLFGLPDIIYASILMYL